MRAASQTEAARLRAQIAELEQRLAVLDNRVGDEDLERQLTLLVDASAAVLSSPTPSSAVQTILRLARRFIPADAYAVWRRNPGTKIWTAIDCSGLSDNYSRTADESQLGGIAWPDEPLAIEDVNQVPLLRYRREVYESEGIRSMLAVPLRMSGITSGTLILYYREPRRFAEREIRVAAALGNIAASALANADLYASESQHRAAAEAAEYRAAFLANAGAILSSSLDYEATLASVAKLATPAFADWCTVDILAADGELRRVAVAHVDPTKIEPAYEFSRRYPPREEDLPRIVLRTGKSVLMDDIPDSLLKQNARDDEHYSLLREIGLKSFIIAPITFGARTLGIVTFASTESGRRYGLTDLRFAEELGRRAAMAVENARLYRESRESEERYRRIVQTATEGMAIVDPRGHVSFVNGRLADLLGYQPDEMIGAPATDFVHPNNREHAAARIREAARDIIGPEDLELRRKDNSSVWVTLSAAPLLSEAGQPIGVLSMFTDVTVRRHAEEAVRRAASVLAERERELSTILDNVPDVISRYGPDLRYQYTSAAIQEHTGRRASEFVGKSHTEIGFPRALAARFDHGLRRVFETGKPGRLEFDFDGPAGRRSYVATAAPELGADGSVVSVLTITHDVTESLRAGQAQRDAEERLRIAVQSANIGTWDFNPITGELQWSQRCREIFGVPPEQEIDYAIFLERVHPEDRERIDQLVQAALDPNGGGEIDADYRAVRPDGVTTSLNVRGKTLFEGERSARRAIRFIGTVIDVTERKREESRSRDLADAVIAISAAKTTDEVLQITAEHAGRIIGAKGSAVLAREGTLPATDARITASLKSANGKAIGDVSASGKDGGEFNASDRAMIVQLAEMASVVLENTRLNESLRQSNDDLRRANEDLNQFAYSASHDLREPLRMVAIYSQLLKRKYAYQLDTEAHEFIDFAVQGAQRMETLVRDLLAYTQAANITEPPDHTVDAADALDRAVNNLQSVVSKTGAKITYDILPELRVREAHLLRLFRNLVENALKYRSDEIPAIHISAKPDGRFWLFSISDNGMGIAPEYVTQIFGMFKRLHSGAKYEGTGMGLAICQRIVERYGGHIWVESEREGKGSRFCFTLPG
jgi:PAS domain S-box-containing protein